MMYSHGRTIVVVVGCLANDWQQLQVTSCIYLTEVTGRGTMYIIREDGPPQYLHNVITVHIVHSALTPHIYLHNTCVRPSIIPLEFLVEFEIKTLKNFEVVFTYYTRILINCIFVYTYTQ